MGAPMSMPLWNSELGAHGERRWPKSELTGPRTGHREGSEARTRLGPPRKRTRARVGRHRGLPADAGAALDGSGLGPEGLPDLGVEIPPAVDLPADLAQPRL